MHLPKHNIVIFELTIPLRTVPVTYSKEFLDPLCNDHVVALGSNFTYTVNCTESGSVSGIGPGDTQWELNTSAGCVLNFTVTENAHDLGQVASCSGQYSLNCSNSSRFCMNLCIVGEFTCMYRCLPIDNY